MSDARSELVFRIMFSLIFIVGGAGHFFAHAHMLGRLNDSPWLSWVSTIAQPSLLIYLSGLVLCLAGIALLMGWFTKLASLALFVTLLPITLAIHVAPGHMGPLLKNVALLGGLIHFYYQGAGVISFDAFRYKSSLNTDR